MTNQEATTWATPRDLKTFNPADDKWLLHEPFPLQLLLEPVEHNNLRCVAIDQLAQPQHSVWHHLGEIGVSIAQLRK